MDRQVLISATVLIILFLILWRFFLRMEPSTKSKFIFET